MVIFEIILAAWLFFVCNFVKAQGYVIGVN